MKTAIIFGSLGLLGMVTAAVGGPPVPRPAKSTPLVVLKRQPSAVGNRRIVRTAPSAPAPGVYAAVPFSATVVVPTEMDAKSVVSTDDGEALTTMRVIEPPLMLVPK